MYSRQTSIFRLVLSFLLAFTVFSALGYVIYRWTPRGIKSWFHRQFGGSKDRVASRDGEYSHSSLEVSSSTLIKRPRRHGRIHGKALYKRGLSDSSESDERKASKKPSSRRSGWRRLLKKFSDHVKRSSGRSSSSTYSSSTSSSSTSYLSKRKSRPRSHRATPNVMRLHLGEYRNDDRKLEQKVGIFHTRVRSLAARHGNEVAEEYFLNAHKFWTALKKREKHRAKLVHALGKELNAQETLRNKVSKEKAQLLKRLKRRDDRLSKQQKQLGAKDQQLSKLVDRLGGLQKDLAAVKGAQKVRLQRLQLAVDQLTADKQTDQVSEGKEVNDDEIRELKETDEDASGSISGNEEPGDRSEDLTNSPDDLGTNLEDSGDSHESLQSSVTDSELGILDEGLESPLYSGGQGSSEDGSNDSGKTFKIPVERELSPDTMAGRYATLRKPKSKNKKKKSHKEPKNSNKKAKRKSKDRKKTKRKVRGGSTR